MPIRLRARKHGMSLAEVANRTGESLSSIKRQSAKNPAQFEITREIVEEASEKMGRRADRIGSDAFSFSLLQSAERIYH
jgi:hypothetical protein